MKIISLSSYSDEVTVRLSAEECGLIASGTRDGSLDPEYGPQDLSISGEISTSFSALELLLRRNAGEQV